MVRIADRGAASGVWRTHQMSGKGVLAASASGARSGDRQRIGSDAGIRDGVPGCEPDGKGGYSYRLNASAGEEAPERG